jgi:Cu-Zn family superoxide dismutase
MRVTSILLFTSSLIALGCGDDDSDDGTTKTASVALTSTTGNVATGSGTFTASGSRVIFSASVANAPASATLGFHIHANGACGADGMEAGGHWNPTNVNHGRWADTMHHLGDIGNITTDPGGAGTIQLTTDAWSIGTGAANDIVNHAVILHAMADDFTTQPTGNAGGRIACGVIQTP